MPDILESFTSNALNKHVWNIRRRVGSMVKFEIGEKVETDRGEFHFWINCAHWWLQQGQEKNFEDIVHSESSQKNMDEKITILNDKKLLNIQFDSETKGVIFDFEDDLFLRLVPYVEDKDSEILYVFTQKDFLVVLSDGTIQVKPQEVT